MNITNQTTRTNRRNSSPSNHIRSGHKQRPSRKAQTTSHPSANRFISSFTSWVYAHFLSSARKRLLTHRLVISLLCVFLGITIFLAFSVLSHRHKEAYIVQTTHLIPRGMIIKDSDLRLVAVSSSLDTSAMATSTQMVSGKISPITLAQGAFIPQSVIEDVPIVPHGYTSIDVTLASSVSSLRVGETISLLTSEETLSDSAVVLHIPQPHHPQQIWETQNSETSAITIALPAHDAMKVLTAQNNSPIITVPLSHVGIS